MIPTLFGVLLLTFILFNVVGGSPAALVLGKHADAEALEGYDELHGYNKPLFWGRWVPTRAWEDYEASQTVSTNWLVAGGSSKTVDWAFALRPGTPYRLVVRYRLAGGRALCRWGVGEQVLNAAPNGETVRIDLKTPPDETCEQMLLTVEGTDALQIESLKIRRRVERPWDSQFLHFIGAALRFDFGESAETHERVLTLLKQGIGPSLCLTIPIFIGGLVMALGMALLCAWFRDRWVDRLIIVAATVLMSVNYIIWIVAGQYLLGFRLGWFPIWGFESWRYLLLPVSIGIFTGLGRDVRFYRAMLLDELYRDYVRTAKAKGAGGARILLYHVLRNALIPIITNASLALPFLFMGSLLLESFFGIPGLGGLSINAINSSDLNVVKAVVFIGALLYVVVNLLTDICYAWADPRVRLR
jgi:peptide/nickel transport system permease protein